jgi:hypothetical protein
VVSPARAALPSRSRFRSRRCFASCACSSRSTPAPAVAASRLALDLKAPVHVSTTPRLQCPCAFQRKYMSERATSRRAARRSSLAFFSDAMPNVAAPATARLAPIGPP